MFHSWPWLTRAREEPWMPLTATRDHFMSRQLSREPVQVRHAREQARKALFKWSLGEHAELGELIVSELVTNALRHGEGKIQVRMPHADGDLRVAVHDSGAGRPVKHQPTVEGESGRGLAQLDGPDRAARRTARPPEQRFQGGQDRLCRDPPRAWYGRRPEEETSATRRSPQRSCRTGVITLVAAWLLPPPAAVSHGADRAHACRQYVTHPAWPGFSRIRGF